MSYDIYIGEAVVVEGDEGCLSVRVNGVGQEIEGAPSFPNDRMTGKGNSRHPSYSGWGDFCREAGLYAMFFDEESGLMRNHPGAFQITQGHLGVVQTALAARKEYSEGLGMTPGFPADTWMKPEFQDKTSNPDHILARLIWLEFWMNWALKNCKNPAIHNH